MGTKLTKREIDILELLAEGHENKKIAEMEGIAETTVRTHVNNIYNKLSLPDGNTRVLAAIYYLKYFA